MKVKWLGHSCFILTSENGVRVLTDPFNDKVGYPVPRVEADLVTVSHQHFDHNNTSVVLGRFTVFDTPGSFNARGIEDGETAQHNRWVVMVEVLVADSDQVGFDAGHGITDLIVVGFGQQAHAVFGCE